MNALDKLPGVLTPDEQRYFIELMTMSKQAMSYEDFAATAKAMLALFKDSEKTRVTLSVHATDEEIAGVRALLTPEENAHLELKQL